MSSLTDKTGALVTVSRDDARGAYVITTQAADEATHDAAAGGDTSSPEAIEAGRSFFFDRDDVEPRERVFFHTEVDEEFGGRGLATILVRVAVDATREAGLLIVPVCPLVRAYLEKNAEAYDGAFRHVTSKDLELVRSHVATTQDAATQGGAS